MRHLTTISMLLALMTAACVLPALADELTLSKSTGSLSFCSVSGGDIYVSAGGFSDQSKCTANSGTLSGSGVLQSNGITIDSGGTYDFTFPGDPSTLMLTPAGAYTWNASNGTSATFTYKDNMGSFSGTITWSPVGQTNLAMTLRGNTFIGGTNYTATGSLAQDYPIGGIAPFVFAVNLSTSSLSNLSTAPGNASGTLMSGQVSDPPVPEVSSILLLGTGLLSAGIFASLRRRL